MGNGDKVKEQIFNRTGIDSNELVCPREKSDMTPCIARDGDCAMTNDGHCIGCGIAVSVLLQSEEQKEQDNAASKQPAGGANKG